MSKKTLSWIRSKKQQELMSGEELAAYRAKQLEHLMLIRDCAARLMAQDQLGRDFFARGIVAESEALLLAQTLNEVYLRQQTQKRWPSSSPPSDDDLPLFRKKE